MTDISSELKLKQFFDKFEKLNWMFCFSRCSLSFFANVLHRTGLCFTVDHCRRRVVIRVGISFSNSSKFPSDHNQWLEKQRQRFFRGSTSL